MYYTGYVLTKISRREILKAFKPRYEKVVCHHITAAFDVPEDTPAPEIPANVRIVGHVDSGDGVEGLLVAIDGTTDRPDGGAYHITLSLAKDRQSVETNNYLKDAQPLPSPLTIMVIPKLLSR